MYIYIYIYMYIYIYTHIYIYIHTYFEIFFGVHSSTIEYAVVHEDLCTFRVHRVYGDDMTLGNGKCTWMYVSVCVHVNVWIEVNL
jgi:hypothetical protein